MIIKFILLYFHYTFWTYKKVEKFTDRKLTFWGRHYVHTNLEIHLSIWTNTFDWSLDFEYPFWFLFKLYIAAWNKTRIINIFKETAAGKKRFDNDQLRFKESESISHFKFHIWKDYNIEGRKIDTNRNDITSHISIAV